MLKTASLLLIALCTTVHAEGTTTSNPHEKVIVSLLKVMNDISGEFEKIKDVDSAKEAKPRLDKLAERLQSVAKDAAKLEKPDPKQDKQLKEKYASQLRTTMNRFIKSARDVSKIPDVQPILRDFGQRLREIGQAMKKVGQ